MFRNVFFSSKDQKVFAIPLEGIIYSEQELKIKFLKTCTESNIEITVDEIQVISVEDNDSGEKKQIPFVCKECNKGIVLENWTMEAWLKIQNLQKCG